MDSVENEINSGLFIEDFKRNKISFYKFISKVKEISKDEMSNHDFCNRVCKYIVRILNKVMNMIANVYDLHHKPNIYERSTVKYVFDELKKSLSGIDNFDFDVVMENLDYHYIYFKFDNIEKYYKYSFDSGKLKEIDKFEFERIRDSYGPVLQLVNKGVSE